MIAKSIPSHKGTRTFSISIRYIEKHEHKREPQLVGSGVSFSDRVSYASAAEKAAWVHLRGVTSVATAPVEMEALAAVSRRCSDPVHHEVIAYAKHEQPTREQIVGDAERLLTALDMEDHQYVLSVHTDTDDLHAHIVVNRVGPDGHANARWHERITRERVCAEIAAERGWAIVVGRHNRDIVRDALGLDELPPEPPRRVYDRDLERTHGTGEIPWQDAARPYVLDAVERATSWDDLRERLGTHGVVLKAVERGGRFQGLAFAESMEPDAPGCGASRISARCKLSVLEERFGSYSGPERARSGEIAAVRPAVAEVWHERMRPVILDAVDRATSWDDLRARLADPMWQIDLKAVERGGRVSGLVFARENIEGAPGCAASRIDARCKLSALEARFGPYPEEFRRDVAPARSPARERNPEQAARAPETGTEAASEGLRARVERDASNGAFSASKAVERARGIAENARLREEYGRYRDAFFEQRREQVGVRRDAAWREESERRREASEKRWEAKQFQRALVRTLTPPGGVRRFGYDVVEQFHQQRTEREREQARERWEAVKDEMNRERSDAQAVAPLRYRDYVAERAQLGDDGARRVMEYLDEQVRNGRDNRAPSPERARPVGDVPERDTRSERDERRVSGPPEFLRHVRPDLFPPEPEQSRPRAVPEKKVVPSEPQPPRDGNVYDRFRWEFDRIEKQLEARLDEIEREKSALGVVYKPKPLQQRLDETWKKMHDEAKARMGFTDSEKKQLEEIEQRKQTWNPWTRYDATKQEKAIVENRDRRADRIMDETQWEFRQRQQSKIITAFERDTKERKVWVEQIYKLDEERTSISRDAMNRLSQARSTLETLEREGQALPEFSREFLRQGPQERLRGVRDMMEQAHAKAHENEKGYDYERSLGLELGFDMDW